MLVIKNSNNKELKMIQAPNLSYIPAQNMMPMAYPQQGAQNAIQYVNTTPGVIYNYPTSSCYMPQ